jgi:hypothetical protein
VVVFLGVQSLTPFRDMRTSLIERFELGSFKSIYSLVALVGFALIVWGFSRYGAEGLITEWPPPARTRRLLATVPGISPGVSAAILEGRGERRTVTARTAAGTAAFARPTPIVSRMAWPLCGG